MFLCYNAFSIFFSSVLGTIIITVLVKIFLSFSVILILYKVSIEKRKIFLECKAIVSSDFIIAALITIGTAIFLIELEWKDYQNIELLMNSSGIFDLVTRETPLYKVLEAWILAYLSRICAIFFLASRKSNADIHSENKKELEIK